MKNNEGHFLKEAESIIECDKEPKIVEAQVISEREERHLQNLLQLVFFRETQTVRDERRSYDYQKVSFKRKPRA